MDDKFKLRLKWIELYQQLGNTSKTCEHFGISRFTLRKWIKRYKQQGQDGLLSLSSKPNNSPSQKRDATNEQLILSLRSERKLGARRVQSELNRLYNITFSLSTIHKVFSKHAIKPLSLKRHYRKRVKRYNCRYPGERVQMDVCKISNKLYQYTAIDDCTRYKVIALYASRTGENTLDFLKQVRARMPFALERIQTDRGREFFAYAVLDLLKEWKIKFRPIRPASPHLNGKVERTQRTDLDEFYSSININDPQLKDKLREWEEYYNKERPHSSLQGKTPFEQYKMLERLTRTQQEIALAYDQSKEIIAIQNYSYDQIIRTFKQAQPSPKVNT